jgi:hypothetical protein
MLHDLETKEYVTSLRLCNSRPTPVTLYLEPWGEQYTMAPEAIFTAVARGPEGDGLEVQFTDDSLTLYGWPGAVVTLFQDGKAVGANAMERAPVPSTPPRL